MKSIGLKLFVIVAVFVTVFSLVLFHRTYIISSEHVNQVVNQQADLALHFDLAIRSYVKNKIRPVMFKFVSEDEFIPETMSTSFVARSIFEETQKEFPGIILKFSSDNPRNPANQASQEELKIIQFFNSNPESDLWEGNISMNGDTYYAMFKARRMEKSCLLCHGDPVDAPQSMLDRYGSTAGFNRPVGEVVAMDTVAIPISTIQNQLLEKLKANLTYMGGALLFLLIALFFVVRFFVTRRIANIADHFKKIATVDDFKGIETLEVHGNDEIDALAKSFNSLAEQLQQYHNSLETEIKEHKKTNILLQEEILERELTEEKLRQSKTVLENVLNSTNPMCITNLNYEIINANQAYFDTFNYQTESADKLIKCYESRPGSLCETDECPVKQILAGKEIVSCQVAKENGGVKYTYIVTARPYRDQNGKLLGIIENFQDISQIKEYEKALFAEKERLAVTLNSIGDGVISTNIDGTIVMINRVAQTLTGWRQEDAAGKRLDEVFHLEDEENGGNNIDLLNKVIQTKQVIEISGQCVLKGKDGTQFLIEDSAAPIFDRLSEVTGIVIVFRDITNEKRIEEELQNARKIDSIGVLAGGIAHDFNNILTAITGNISLAKMFTDPESKAQTRLDEAEKACVRATALTQQLITFSKGGAPVKRTTSIKELLEDSAAFALRGSNVRCDLTIGDGLYPCDIDDGQISQAFNEIVINADQSMPEGGVITVDVSNATVTESDNLSLKNGEYVKIVIQDTGVGIAQKHIDKIFDPYFSTKEKGSGLGLTSSYSIINKHGGYIGVESQVGKGSTFTLYLPASQIIYKSEERKISQKTPLPVGGRILVMDDEEPVRSAAKEMLSYLGYEAELAVDGDEAVTMFKDAIAADSPYVAVILDLTIPGGMGGSETVKRLRKIDPAVKAIVSSGYSNDPIMADYKKYGFTSIIIKPYRINDLEDALKQTVSNDESDTN
jgi:PAS domain S-box-containing protein